MGLGTSSDCPGRRRLLPPENSTTFIPTPPTLQRRRRARPSSWLQCPRPESLGVEAGLVKVSKFPAVRRPRTVPELHRRAPDPAQRPYSNLRYPSEAIVHLADYATPATVNGPGGDAA